jgi:N-acetylmuramoyl-L-alanine amidase
LNATYSRDDHAWVAELQQRLAQLGYHSTDLDGDFGARTTAAVEAFQRAKGLRITGEVDDATWRRLLEASWRLGDRLLYLSTPLLRGDDVAEIQLQLSQLGFDSGHIDGIFGVTTEHALGEFQRNCGLEPSGTLDRNTLVELRRLAPSDPSRPPVTDARADAGLFGFNGPIAVSGTHPIVATLVQRLADNGHDVVALTGDKVAQQANELRARLMVAIEGLPQDHVTLHYWVGYRSHSRQGENIATAIATHLSQSATAPRVEIAGMAHDILRETRMPALHVEVGSLTPPLENDLVSALAATFTELFHR